MRTLDVPVLIVGAGPAGLAATALLATAGIRSLTVTRYSGTANSPRAHITNQRTVEVFRDLGLEDRLTSVATPAALMSNNVWATSFAGTEIARLQTWGTSPERRADYELASPSAMCNAPQHLLEPVLLTAARERGAEFMFSTELLEIAQDEGGVTAQVQDRTSGERVTVRAQYVIGADGGNSVVGAQCGFEYDGQMGLAAAVNCWLEVDLTKYTEHRPGVLYWMTQPGNNYWVGSGTWICVRPWTEWVLLFMYDPAQGEPDLSDAAVIERARATIGDDSVPIRVKAANRWKINHMAVRQMSRGRVFLAGDAAHRHPPANGLGTNTSIQDSFNLAWKLAMVLKGQAGSGLLDSYSAERQPVARQVVDRAMKSVQDMLPISEALGFTPGQNEAEGWANVDELFSDSAQGRQRRAALDRAVALQHYQFNCHGVELGQVYASSAVIDEGASVAAQVAASGDADRLRAAVPGVPMREPGPAAPLPDSEPAAPLRDPELYHLPSTRPGASLPHAWLQTGLARVSTLDLVGHGVWTLIVGPAGAVWMQAAAAAAETLALPLAVRSIGGPKEDAQDVYGRWRQLREIGDAGCLLVRPDRHIAWRQTALPYKPEAALLDVLRTVLSLPG